jgi:hypothetical protein
VATATSPATAEQVAATLEPQINALLQQSLQLPK